MEADLCTNVKEMSLTKVWKPHYLTTLPTLSPDVLSKIPAGNMVTFHPDFIHNTFDGVTWSPGLRFIKGPGSCILKNRTYYLLDPKTEPFLPKEPGEHGAKLTAFFNASPEEEFSDLLDEDCNSYEDVPMFIMIDKRYVYFGNYSQTRWSDKLDYDTMMAKVPQNVKQYWATELSSACREDWVTDELKKHFFEKPEYEGRLYAALDEEATVNSDKALEFNEHMAKDVKKYIKELREWEREANMRVSLIKDDFILQAFDRVSLLNIEKPEASWRFIANFCRLMQMIRRLYAFGGSTSSAWIGRRTSTSFWSLSSHALPASTSSKAHAACLKRRVSHKTAWKPESERNWH